MAGLTDILSAIQSGVGLLGQIQDTLTHLVPQLSSGHLGVDTLIQPGYVRVLGVSVLAGTGTPKLHDVAALANAAAGNAVYAIPIVAGYYPTNMVFTNGLVLKIGTATEVAIFYART